MEHDIITRDANSVSWTELWEFSKSQRDIIDAVTISEIIVFEIICYVAYYSAALHILPIEQPSNKAAKCGTRRSFHISLKVNGVSLTINQVWFRWWLGVDYETSHFEPMMAQLLTYICDIRPEWVNGITIYIYLIEVHFLQIYTQWITGLVNVAG